MDFCQWIFLFSPLFIFYKEILSLSSLILNALKLGNKALNLSNIIFSTPLLGHLTKSPSKPFILHLKTRDKGSLLW